MRIACGLRIFKRRDSRKLIGCACGVLTNGGSRIYHGRHFHTDEKCICCADHNNWTGKNCLFSPELAATVNSRQAFVLLHIQYSGYSSWFASHHRAQTSITQFSSFGFCYCDCLCEAPYALAHTHTHYIRNKDFRTMTCFGLSNVTM